MSVDRMTLELYTVPSTEITPAQLDAVVALCSEVFKVDYTFYMNLDLYRVHVLGYIGDRLVAHALWLTRRLRVGMGPWLQAAYVEGVATHAGFRGRGYGSAVMRRLQGEIGGFDLAALSPADPHWYERLGWERWQGPLFIVKDGDVQATPDDCVVVYRTLRSADLAIGASLTAEWRPFELW